MSTQIFTKLFTPPPSAAAGMLSSPSKQDAKPSFGNLRESLASSLSENQAFCARLANKDTSSIAAEKLLDLVQDAIDTRHGSTASRTHWSDVVPALINLARPNEAESMLEDALVACSALIGERPYLSAQSTLSRLAVDVKTRKLRQSLAVEALAVSERVGNELLFMMTRDGSKAPIKVSQLKVDIKQLLDTWSRTEYPDDRSAGLDFVRMAIDRICVSSGLSSQLFELAVLKIERECGQFGSTGAYNPITPACELLLGVAPRLPALQALAQHGLDLFAPAPQLHALLTVWVAAQSRPEARLASQLFNDLQPQTLVAAGLNHASVMGLISRLSERMRDKLERAQLDGLTNALEHLAAVCESVEIAQSLTSHNAAQFTKIARQVTEGASDVDGPARMERQIIGMFSEAVIASTLHVDLGVAKAGFRRKLAMQLDVERDAAAWRRNKQIGAALLQLEAESPRDTAALQRVRPLLKDIEEVVTDQLRFPLAWWKEALSPSQSHLGEFIDGEYLLTEVAAAKRKYGRKALSRLCQGLARRWGRSVQPWALRQELEEFGQRVLTQLGTTNKYRELVELFEQVISKSVEISAVTSLAVVRTQVISALIEIGTTQPQSQRTSSASSGAYIRDAWRAGKHADVAWTLQRLSYLGQYASSDLAGELNWAWSVAVARHIKSVPLAVMVAVNRHLQDALNLSLQPEEANWVAERVLSLYRGAFGVTLSSESSERSPAAKNPVALQGPLWTQVFTRQDQIPGDWGEKQATRLTASAPVELKEIAAVVARLIDRQGDEESMWEATLPAMEDLVRAHGAAVAEDRWRSWAHTIGGAQEEAASLTLVPTLLRGLVVQRQVSLALVLIGVSDGFCKRALDRAATRLSSSDSAQVRQTELDTLLRQIGGHLKKNPPSLAILNVLRDLCSEWASKWNLSTQGWRGLWLCVDFELRKGVDVSTRSALSRLTSTLCGAADLLPSATAFAREVLCADDWRFSESLAEERSWRELMGCLMASAVAADHGPTPGPLLLQRTVLSCPGFASETVSSWSARRQALEEAFTEFWPREIKDRLAARHAQIVSTLFNLAKLAEVPDVSAGARQGVALSEAPYAASSWRCAAVRQAGLPDIHTSGDSIAEAISRVAAREVSADSNVWSRLTLASKYEAPAEIRRKKLLGSELMEISRTNRTGLSTLVRLVSFAGLLSPSEVRSMVFDTIRTGFGGLNADQISKLFVFYESSKRKGEEGLPPWSLLTQAGRQHILQALNAARVLSVRDAGKEVVQSGSGTSTVEAEYLLLQSVLIVAGINGQLSTKNVGLQLQKQLAASAAVLDQLWKRFTDEFASQHGVQESEYLSGELSQMFAQPSRTASSDSIETVRT